jgi:hypothetical protein
MAEYELRRISEGSQTSQGRASSVLYPCHLCYPWLKTKDSEFDHRFHRYHRSSIISSRLYPCPSVSSVVQNKGFGIRPQISLMPQIKHDQFETVSVPSVSSVVQNKGFRIGPQISLMPQIKQDQFETVSVPICAIRGSKKGIQNWTTDFTDITDEDVSVRSCYLCHLWLKRLTTEFLCRTSIEPGEDRGVTFRQDQVFHWLIWRISFSSDVRT